MAEWTEKCLTCNKAGSIPKWGLSWACDELECHYEPRPIPETSATTAQNEKARFGALRKMVMEAIRKELEIDNCCKSYEGTFEWTVCFPDYFDDPEAKESPECYILTLHCYVLGPGRHYDWRGKTMAEVLDKAEEEIKSWLI